MAGDCRCSGLLRKGLADKVIVRPEALEGGAVQFLLVVGMGYADDGLGSLLEGFAVEVDCSVLGHEPPAPEVRTGAILLTPLLVTEGMAMMALPPLERDAP